MTIVLHSNKQASIMRHKDYLRNFRNYLSSPLTLRFAPFTHRFARCSRWRQIPLPCLHVREHRGLVLPIVLWELRQGLLLPPWQHKSHAGDVRRERQVLPSEKQVRCSELRGNNLRRTVDPD